jgi:hypothetical protein
VAFHHPLELAALIGAMTEISGTVPHRQTVDP